MFATLCLSSLLGTRMFATLSFFLLYSELGCLPPSFFLLSSLLGTRMFATLFLSSFFFTRNSDVCHPLTRMFATLCLSFFLLYSELGCLPPRGSELGTRNSELGAPEALCSAPNNLVFVVIFKVQIVVTLEVTLTVTVALI
jgi:hypothetical protein